MARHLPLLCLAVVLAAAAAAPAHAIFHFDFRTDMMSPFDSSYSRHDVWRRAALSSNARVAKQADALGKSLGKKPKAAAVAGAGAGDISESDAAAGNVNHWMSVGIGTPPQPAKLIIDTGSPVIWAQCASSPGPKVRQQADPIYDQAKSSSYKPLPCSDKLCQGGVVNCTTDNKCSYSVRYTILSSEGAFATDTFTFGKKRNVAAPLAFGCGNVALASASGPDLEGASGTMSLAWNNLSLISQLSVPKFSYCFTPFAERKPSPLLFGKMADLEKYKQKAASGPAQTVSLIKNPANEIHYYVPMVGISLGEKKLDVPAASLALDADGGGGTIVDSALTLAYFAEPVFDELKKAVEEAVKLPAAKSAAPEYKVCFALPEGTSMEKVPVPPLRLHFDGGAEMVVPRDNYFQEPSPGIMCLAATVTPEGFFPNMISNGMQQNLHVLYDVKNRKMTFAPTQCDKL